MAQATPTRRILVKVDTSGASGLKDIAKNLNSVNDSTKKLSDGMKFLTNAFKGFLTGIALRELKTFAEDIINTGDQLNKMSQSVGISVEELAKLKVSAELSDVPLELLGKSLNKLNVAITESTTGNSEASAAFKSLGVSVLDANGKTRSASDILLSMSDRFNKLADGSAKSALAIKIFGKSGAGLIPFLNQGSEQIQKFSLNIDSEFAASAEKFNDNLKIVTLGAKNFAIEGIGVILPVLNEAIEKFNSFESVTTNVADRNKFLTSLTTLLAISFKTVVEVVAEAGDLIKTGFLQAIELSIGILKTFITGIDELVKRLQYLGTGDIASAFSLGQSDTVDSFKNMYGKINKLGEDFATRTKTRFYDVLTFSGNLEDKLQNGFGKSAKPVQSLPSVDASELNKKIARERELLEVLKGQGLEQKALQQLELKRYQMTEVQYENAKDRYKTEQDILKATKSFDRSNPKEAALAAQYEQEAKLQQRAREENRLALDEQKRGLEGFSVGASSAFKTYVDQASDTAAMSKQLFLDAFKGMEDGLVSFIKTGKMNFADFANAIIDDIIRIEVRMALAGLIGQVTSAFVGGAASSGTNTSSNSFNAGNYAGWSGTTNGFANGGIMTDRGVMPLHSYASGGIANSPQMAMFGEGRMPEAYVPLPNGRSIPVEMSGNTGGTNVVVNVNMESGQTDTKSDGAEAERLGVLIANVVKKVIVDEKRSGGILTK